MKIGLTGNIASGKSEVEKIISALGYQVYDLDKICHNLYLNNEIIKKLQKNFNTVNRKEISEIVFLNPEKMKILENIIHPELRKFIESIKTDKIVFISGALLYEAHFDGYFDKIIFVDANIDTRLKRLIKRNNLTKSQAAIRINSQNTDNILKADYVIKNNNSIEELKNNVCEILNKITK